MEEENENFQLVPPHLHRRNSAERAIQTFKNHFIAGIVSTHKDFPIHLWCRLLPQAIVTLNLLRTSIINPTLSAHAQLHGLFDFNATPIAPPGTKLIVHQNPTIRKSWAPRGKYGWHIVGHWSGSERHLKIVWEELNCVWLYHCSCFWHVYIVTGVMVLGPIYVPSIFTSRCPTLSDC